MQQRRTASNPGSLPLTSQDISNNNSKKQSHRSRLRRGGKKSKNSNYFGIGLLTVLSLILGSVSLVYFFFGAANKGGDHHHHRNTNHGDRADLNAQQKYRNGRNSNSNNNNNNNNNNQEQHRHPGKLHEPPLGEEERHQRHENRRRRISPEDEWRHTHGGEEEEEDYENRRNMMHFRPDMNAGVNLDRERDMAIKRRHEKNGKGLMPNDKPDKAEMGENKLQKQIGEKKIKMPASDIINANNIKSEEAPLVPLSNIESIGFLKNVFAQTQFVGLYFASSWCPQSTPATEALENAFKQHSDDLLLSPKSFLPDNNNIVESTKKQLGIIYISSDRSQSEMDSFVKTHNDWMIPMYNKAQEEISQIKRMFHTCAEEETSKILNIERKYGIPRFVILDSETKQVLTTDGVNDVLNDGVKALERWKDLKQVKDVAVAILGTRGKEDVFPNIVIQ